jgi:hypothetical protein
MKMNTELLTNILSWGGCGLLLLGLRLIGDKKVLGFWIASAAELMWIVWGVMTHSYALVAMSLAILLMYARAIWKWKSE